MRLFQSPLPRFPLVLFLLLAAVPARGVDITHGPILGRPGATEMAIWARTATPGAFQVRYGTDPGALDTVAQSDPTLLENDNTGVVSLTGLQPDTRYHYQVFTEGGGRAPGGTFRTLPDPKSLADPALNPRGLFNFRFHFACGNNQDPESGAGPSLPAYDTLNARERERIDFSILNGDWLYEDSRDYPVSEWTRQVGITGDEIPEIVRLAPSITGAWQNYKVYLDRGVNLSEWHRHVPSYFTIDDHELINDIYGPATAGFQSRRAVFRDIGVRAWHDYLAWSNPAQYPGPAWFGKARLEAESDILTDAEADFTALPLDEMANLHVHWGHQLAGMKDPEPDASLANPNFNNYDIVEVLDAHRLRIHPAARADGEAAYSIGRRNYGKFRVSNCDFLLLDTRSHRDLHDFKNPARPDLSMLGKKQLEWLIDSVTESDADFIFIVSSVNFMVPHVGAGGATDLNPVGGGKDDAWTVFLHEREKLINLWDSLRQPVFVLTGDLHNSFAIKITDNVWEFASGPHNSVNHRPVEDEGDRPANGRYQYGPRPCDIRWSSYVLSDIPRPNRLFPHYCIVQLNNVFNNPLDLEGTRWVAYPHPQVIFQFYDGFTGELRYAETITTSMD